MQSWYLFLADAVLVLHGVIVCFNIAVLPVVWIGYCRGWGFVRNPYFRTAHLLLLGFVTGEAVLGAVCPLTTLENALRFRAGQGILYAGGYVSYWLQRLIFWDCGTAVFGTLYGLYFALVLFTFLKVKPRLPDWWPSARLPVALESGPRSNRQPMVPRQRD